MNDKRKTTRARARVAPYKLAASDPAFQKLVRSIEESDLDHFKRQARRLSPAGQRLLLTVFSLSVKRSGQAGYAVAPFTRAELGNELRRGAPLNPHDIKLLASMVELQIVQVDREPLPAKRFIGAAGDELMLGAGWQYVYMLRPLAALALLRAMPKHRAAVDKLLQPQDEISMLESVAQWRAEEKALPWWKRL